MFCFLLLSTATARFLMNHPSVNTTDSNWSYHGGNGPTQWGRLDPAFKTCSIGKRQSPIDLQFQDSKNIVQFQTNVLKVDWGVNSNHEFKFAKNGKIGAPKSGYNVTYLNATFNLLNLHFHYRSEHHFNGTDSALEMHMVHKDENNKLVIGVMIEESSKTSELLQSIVKEAGNHNGFSLDFSKLVVELDSLKNVYTYKGSTTTPPCTENVYWIIPEKRLSITSADLEVFKGMVGNDSRRPIQVRQ
jgi:carbonic anhydrase